MVTRAPSSPFAVPAGELPATTRLGCVRLQVSDLSRSLVWYTESLGARVLSAASAAHEPALGVVPPPPASAFLAAHGDDRPLIGLIEHRGARPVAARGRLGLFHLAVLLPDRAALGRFVAHLATRDEALATSDHLVSEAVYLRDPDGLGIEVYADRPRSEWRWTRGEVTMATETLDVASLLRAGDGEAWAGLPIGTSIGHVHLHVGDLSTATSFYSNLLGLEVTQSHYPGARFFAAGGYHHHLAANTWAGPAATPPEPDDAQLLSWALVLPDDAAVETCVQRLVERGIAVRREDAHGETVWRVDDPWGTVLHIAPE